MRTKVLAILALATIANGNDVIVGLKTDGNKFFDENRQAIPALWRQMDNVTIKAPENEVIRRVVITDLRPAKDGDARIVEGGEGQKNVTIELKSPTVLRGYEFNIEVYSTPEEIVPLTDDQQSTTEIVQNVSTTSASTNPTTNLDTTSKISDVSTDKIVPPILLNDEVKDSERQGRNAKNEEGITSESTTELTSTTFKYDVSTTLTTQYTDSETKNSSEKNSDTPNKIEHDSTLARIPLNNNFNINPVIPAISGRDIADDKFNVSSNEENRRVRDTESKSEKSTEAELNINPTNVRFESSTENDKETSTTEISDEIPVEEKSEEESKEDVMTTAKPFNNRKYTSIISTKVERREGSIDVKDAEKQRNVRGANEEQKIDESTSTPGESTTTDISFETSTISSDDCVTTEAANFQNPVNVGKDEASPVQVPMYINDRKWNQRFNNPTFQTGDGQSSPGIKVYPAVLPSDQSFTPDTDAERLGNDYKPSPDHMENKNPKVSTVASYQDKNMTPVISTQ